MPATSGAGLTISVTDTTKNQGQGSAIATKTKFYLSANTTLDAADVLLGSRAVPTLITGAASSGTTSVTIPAGTRVQSIPDPDQDPQTFETIARLEALLVNPAAKRSASCSLAFDRHAFERSREAPARRPAAAELPLGSRSLHVRWRHSTAPSVSGIQPPCGTSRRNRSS